jgi:hypothetical protein
MMQTFICPECSHKSTYDPWTESACCPQCGFAPSIGDRTVLSPPFQGARAKPPYREQGRHSWRRIAFKVISGVIIAWGVSVFVAGILGVFTWVVILAAILVATLSVLLAPLLFGLVITDWRPCPRCRALRSRELVREEVVGIFKRGIENSGSSWPDYHGNAFGSDDDDSRSVYHTKYRLHFRCRRCDYEWISIQIERA